MNKKKYIINLLLLVFTLIMLITFKGMLFFNLAYYNIIDFGILLDYYKEYFFINNHFEDHPCVLCLETTDRWPFDNIIFKFSIFSFFMLIMLKNKFTYTKNIFSTIQLILFVIYMLSIFYISTLVISQKILFQANYIHIIQELIFIIYILSFILYVCFMSYIYINDKYSTFIKIALFLLSTLFIYELLYNIYVFLVFSGNSLEVNDGLRYILSVYDISHVYCMNEESVPKDTNFCHVRKYLMDKACFESKPLEQGLVNVTAKTNCDVLATEYKRYCIQTAIAETKK